MSFRCWSYKRKNAVHKSCFFIQDKCLADGLVQATLQTIIFLPFKLSSKRKSEHFIQQVVLKKTHTSAPVTLSERVSIWIFCDFILFFF